MTSPIHYRIACAHPGAHLFHVTLTIAQPDSAGCVISLPAWIPGSYMIREFARNIVTISARSARSARSGRKSVALTKIDKHSWRAAPCVGSLVVEYEVYAWDLSVRAAHLDETHGFFNGTSVFLRVLGREQAPHAVDIVRPAGRAYAAWRVATSLPRARATAAYGFGAYTAEDYDALIDHPVEMGAFTLVEFAACGVPHAVAITGRHDCDTARLVADLTRICEAQLRLFHGVRAAAKDAPFASYLFLVLAVGEGYGGLEHRASTALICARQDLPHAGLKETSEGYRTFLGLCSHEYFHAWNVKRIKPAAFTPYDFTQENYTSLLWAFEGFTSYYDDLMLLRAQAISLEEYLNTLSRTIRQVMRGAGRNKQSVAESSFDAWIKYYRQDENAPNAIVSYYTKGALIALCLDLMLRTGTRGQRSLDDVMRLLWADYGLRQTGVPEDGIERAVLSVADAGADTVAKSTSGLATANAGRQALRRQLPSFFRNVVRGTAPLPLKRLLKDAGFVLDIHAGNGAGLGIRTAAAADGVRLTHVLDGGGAQMAGLSSGDVIIAVDGLKMTHAGFDHQLARKPAGVAVEVHAFRRDELIRRQVRVGSAEIEVTLMPASQPPSAGKVRRRPVRTPT